MADKSRYVWGIDAGPGTIPHNNDSTLNIYTFNRFRVMMRKSIVGGNIFNNSIISL